MPILFLRSAFLSPGSIFFLSGTLALARASVHKHRWFVLFLTGAPGLPQRYHCLPLKIMTKISRSYCQGHKALMANTFYLIQNNE